MKILTDIKKYILLIITAGIITILPACSYENNSGIIYEKQEIVASLLEPYREVMIIFSSGLGSYSPVSVVNGQLIGGIEYEGQWYIEVNDESFPHIRSIQDIRDKTETVFTQSYAESAFYTWAFDRFYREIDGVLHRAVADAPNSWTWTADDILIEAITSDSFIAIAPLEWELDEWTDSVKFTFRRVGDNWRIDGVELGSFD